MDVKTPIITKQIRMIRLGFRPANLAASELPPMA